MITGTKNILLGGVKSAPAARNFPLHFALARLRRAISFNFPLWGAPAARHFLLFSLWGAPRQNVKGNCAPQAHPFYYLLFAFCHFAFCHFTDPPAGRRGREGVGLLFAFCHFGKPLPQ